MVLAVSIGVVALVAVYSLEGLGVIPHEIAPTVIYSVIVLLVGIWIVNIAGQLTLRVLRPRAGSHAFTVRNVVLVLGYSILAIAILSIFGVSPDVALAGGTVTGLVIGLGAQLVLSNFFAGLVILVTGFISVGDEVRFLTSQLPYQAATLPAYKYFSADYVNYGYKGRVVEVGLMSSTLITDTGLGMKVPNQIILNSAVVDYQPAQSTTRTLQVRYEFSVSFDPSAVLARVREALAGVQGVEKVVFNEQSDKEFLIVLVEFVVPIQEDWSLLKSEILLRLARLHRELKAEQEEETAERDPRGA